MMVIREAREEDVEAIREIFIATYDRYYAHSQYYNVQTLKKIVFDEATLMLVAEDVESGQLLGTASILYDTGAFGDLVGEFGRMAVHPDGRKRGIGKLLMEARLRHVEGRLHLALVENRVVHPFSQRISSSHGFVPVGLMPQKLHFQKRETVALFARHFGDALRLRRNNPRVIPEAYGLADLVLRQLMEHSNVIADTEAPAYPRHEGYEVEEFKTKGYASLMRLERGRVAQREVFGPVQLHQGLFKLRATHSNYLMARENGQVVGGVGYTIEEAEKSAMIFEVVSVDERPIRFLLEELEGLCRDKLGVEYMEVDVSAYSPQMQRTFLELGFLPVAYIPAAAFHKVERRDAVRMARLFVPIDIEGIQLYETTQPVAKAVLRNFLSREVAPRIAAAMPGTVLCRGLTEEQARQVGGACVLESFESGAVLFSKGETDCRACLILEGAVEVSIGGEGPPLAMLGPGDFVGETCLVDDERHTVSGVVKSRSKVALLSRDRFERLVRRRPDIGVMVYRNLAAALGRKLRGVDERVAGQLGGGRLTQRRGGAEEG